MTEQTTNETTEEATVTVEPVPVEPVPVEPGPTEAASAEVGDERNHRKVREGLVISDKMDKTVVVSVEDHVKHALYGKVMRRTSKLKAHDQDNACGIGDRVLLMETRPSSATKRWRVVRVLEKAK